jgi:predicted nucleotidyltransferase
VPDKVFADHDKQGNKKNTEKLNKKLKTKSDIQMIIIFYSNVRSEKTHNHFSKMMHFEPKKKVGKAYEAL